MCDLMKSFTFEPTSKIMVFCMFVTNDSVNCKSIVIIFFNRSYFTDGHINVLSK